VGMMTMNQLDAASLRKTWDREVQDFRTTCQVSSQVRKRLQSQHLQLVWALQHCAMPC
jgi:hypothetical protein